MQRKNPSPSITKTTTKQSPQAAAPSVSPSKSTINNAANLKKRNTSPSPFSSGHNNHTAVSPSGANGSSPSPKPLTNFQKSMMAANEIKMRQLQTRGKMPSVSPASLYKQQQLARAAASTSPDPLKRSSTAPTSISPQSRHQQNSSNKSTLLSSNSLIRSQTSNGSTSASLLSSAGQPKPILTHQQLLLAKLASSGGGGKGLASTSSTGGVPTTGKLHIPTSISGFPSTAPIAEKVCSKCDTAYTGGSRFCGVCGKKREWIRAA